MNTTLTRSTSVTRLRPARWVMGLGIAFMVLLALLHGLRPDRDPAWEPISEYALGAFGWMMTLAFLAWGLSAALLFVALRPHVATRLGRVGMVFLLFGAAGPILAALFPTDPVTTPVDALSTIGIVHSIGASIVDSMLIGATLLTISLLRNKPQWHPYRKPLILTLILGWIMFVVVIVSMGILLPQHGGQLGPETPVGWISRILVVVYASWLITAAWCIQRVESQLAR